MSESELFTLVTNKKKNKIELVFGYSGINRNRVVLDVTSVDGKNTLTNPISFNAARFKEILVNNTVKDTVLKISEQGMAFISFDEDGFQSEYYMISIPVED